MMYRHASADACARGARKLERARRRRSSVVDWINGLTDNNPVKEDSSWQKPQGAHERVTRNGSVIDVEDTQPDNATKHKDELIAKLKREVKMIMEEAVTKRLVDLHSAYVTSLCASIDACLMDGLRRRLLGLFGSRSSIALLHSVAKQNPAAQMVVDKLAQTQYQPRASPHLEWIREALHMRALSTIIHFINTSKGMRRFYESTALMVDRAKGGMVAALLLGPCAVTYRRMGLEEQLGQTAVPAAVDEATDRASSSSSRAPQTPKTPNPARPPLSIVRQGSSIVSSVDRGSVSNKDYVYSLHHNFRTNLLYGKNNVCVAAPGEETPIKGYLSLHKNHDGEISLKWTPNQLMHASSQPCSANGKDIEQNWKQALNIQMQDIIYIHLHQKDENHPSTLTFVNCEGVQSAPLQLPAGQHSLVFLTALETGLAPSLRLDPPLWAGHGKEKALPRLRKRSTASSTMMDYVFRLVRVAGNDPIPFDDIEPPSPPLETPPNIANNSNCISLPNTPFIVDTNVDSIVNMQMGKACESMRHQILARAFYGWLTYCRHLKTIRKHLLYLVETNVIQGEEEAQPVDEEFWKKCRAERTSELEKEFLSRVYWRGIEGGNPKELRRQAWPYLIGLFAWDENPEPKTGQFTKKYRQEVEEWRVLEAEVRKRDEEAFIAARAKKFSSPVRESSMASEVFEDDNRIEELDENEPGSSEILLNTFTTNLHRIDKDVERCDRNLFFFSNKENLESLRRVMITYVRRNLDEGYVQGMCDILAPLLVIFEDEALTIECFTILMSRLRENFPQRTGMDECLSNLRSLIQVIDPQIFSLLAASTDCTHLYFSYRWFLLDFKRELSYDCTYKVWETIWAANRTFTPHFALFFALAIITNYRDVIIGSQMDFTDMIKFFNEMAERHDCTRLLQTARSHIKALQNFVQQLK